MEKIICDFAKMSKYNGTMEQTITSNLKSLKIIEVTRDVNGFDIEFMGVRNSKNEWLIFPNYRKIDIDMGLLICSFYGNYSVDIFKVNNDSIITKEHFEDFCFSRKNLTSCKRNDYFGCLDSELTVVIPFVFKEPIIFEHSDHLLLESINGFCIVSTTGISKYINDTCLYATVLKQDRIGYQNSKGFFGIVNYKAEIIVPFIYNGLLKVVSHDLIGVREYKKMGYVNINTGENVIPCIYDDISPFDNAIPIALVKLNGQDFFIDKKGNVINPLDFLT